MADKDFDFTCLPSEARDPEIKQEDFVLQQADGAIHEQKFQTKPTTFFKDSLKRFRKNKSSVVAAYILGILILLAIFVPIFSSSDVSKSADSALKNLEPKLFDGGGFWDGTTTVSHREVDPAPGKYQYYPDPDLYYRNGVSNIRYEGTGFTNRTSKYGTDGYVQTGFFGGNETEEAYMSTLSTLSFIQNDVEKFKFDDDNLGIDFENTTLTLTNFVVCDETTLRVDESLPQGFELGLTSLEFVYYVGIDEKVIELSPAAKTHTVGESGGEATINISEKVLEKSGTQKRFKNFHFRIKTSKTSETTPEDHVCSLVRSFVITTDSDNYGQQVYFSTTTDETSKLHGISFDDAMQMMLCESEVEFNKNTTYKNPGNWKVGVGTKFVKAIHQARAHYATFTYDSYQATLGQRVRNVDNNKFKFYAEDKGWIEYEIKASKTSDGRYVCTKFELTILDPEHCPIVEEEYNENPITKDRVKVTGYDLYTGDYIFSVDTDVIYYKYLGYDVMPKFIFGTDKTGRDMFKYVFEGLRNSLLLGVITFAVCFTFGLIWGAICGYFGGAVDLVMERFTDILSGVPWIVVMTIVVLRAGSSIGTFAFALCLTGWIGTAATTRTQFYRFRGREYVLASRTLGASDARLIAKHILPNAMGTIITGAVLMIPSVIFSEATISYLGLGFKDLSSLGVILSNNQSELINHPYQLIFPSVVIALVMISFNLFGNGLRDAINPSLKGEGE